MLTAAVRAFRSSRGLCVSHKLTTHAAAGPAGGLKAPYGCRATPAALLMGDARLSHSAAPMPQCCCSDVTAGPASPQLSPAPALLLITRPYVSLLRCTLTVLAPDAYGSIEAAAGNQVATGVPLCCCDVLGLLLARLLGACRLVGRRGQDTRLAVVSSRAKVPDASTGVTRAPAGQQHSISTETAGY